MPEEIWKMNFEEGGMNGLPPPSSLPQQFVVEGELRIEAGYNGPPSQPVMNSLPPLPPPPPKKK